MNVVQRENCVTAKKKPKLRNELVRKDVSTGIRGATTLLPAGSYNAATARTSNNVPRYKFSREDIVSTSKKSMGPPLGPPKNGKRKIINNSNSTRLESSSSGRVRPKVLASDSAAADTSQDFCTPRNRPTALRYISSSSRGGYSGTKSTRSTSISVVQASVILAISEGRGMARGEIGIAAIDLTHPHLVLCQFSDTLLYTHTMTKINYFNPVEIIVPHTFYEGVQPNQLYKLIRDQYPLVNLTTVQRRHFNDAAGRQQIQSLCAPQYNAVYLQVLHKFYALTAAAAVLKYVEYIQCIVFARESLKIEYHSSENTMIIDVGTAVQLELVQPLVPSAGSTCCLLGVLGPTYTVGGIRALRASILQPSCNREFIDGRLDAVQDLIDNDSGLMTSLQDVIKKLSEVDKILLLCVEAPNQNMDKVGEAQLNQTLLLKTTMDLVPNFVEALSVAESGRLRKIKLDFENPHYKEIAERIRSVLQEDAHLERGAMGSLQRCFAIKPDINGLLDVARRTYSELIEDIQKIVEQLGETYDLNLRLNQNVMKGFHIVLPIAPKNRRSFSVADLPPIFIQVQNSGASVTMTTEELVVLDQQAKESLNEIQKMSNIVISTLLRELRPFMSSLYKLCENVAELDMLLAFAQASTISSYIRPEFNNYLDLRNSVHPLLDYNSQVMPIPNDIYASPEQNFTLITGPNMGGKSIYIKQIALMQIMAQVGCFLPATNAVLRLCDRLFSRIGFNDSVELNASTFVYEMKEMQHILQGMTPSSLVIVDELCRGTSTEEGTSMAWAICEELIMSDAFTFFTTHFGHLTRLQDLYFNVINRYTVVKEEEITNTQNSQETTKRLFYEHKIAIGTTAVEHYGLALAARTNLPEHTVKLAIELAEVIDRTTKPQEIKTPQRNDEALLYKLNAQIRQELRKVGETNESVKQILTKFKQEHPQLVERLRMQSRSNNRSSSVNKLSALSSSRKALNLLSPSLEVRCDLVRQNITRGKNCNASSTDTDIDTDRNEKIVNRVDTSSSGKSIKSVCPKVISSNNYSELDSPQNDYNTISYHNVNGIKSSNELLTSMINISDDCSMGEPLAEPNNKDCIEILPNSNTVLTNEEVRKETMIEENSMFMDIEDVSKSSSDIADALTQVIEENSQEHMICEESTSSLEELAMETINEIHEELWSETTIMDIVLTPPPGFRDEIN